MSFFSFLQDELYQIEEERLLKRQKHFDLSLKPIKRDNNDFVSSETESGVRQISVAEANSLPNELRTSNNLNKQNINTVMLSGSNSYDQVLPKRMNRVAMKMNAFQVRIL